MNLCSFTIQSLLAGTLFTSAEGSAPAPTVIPADGLQEDLALLREALETLHPGLYRYNDEESLEDLFEAAELEFLEDRSLRDAYLVFSRLTAGIRCGHTYCNFWNQPESVQSEVFGQKDKLPFTFRLVGRRMIVTENLAEDVALPRGTEILSIDGQYVDTVLQSLRELVKADGSNDAKRLADLELSGWGKFEPFDVYFPLLFPPRNGLFRIQARLPGSSDVVEVALPAVTRPQRLAALERRLGTRASTAEELWEFRHLNDETAYLRLGTFVTWHMEMDWKEFLRKSFETIDTNQTPNLILDIRGNEGGSDEVVQDLLRHLFREPVSLGNTRQLLRYEKVPASLDPYLDTWDPSFKDRTGEVVEVEDGFYAWKGASTDPVELPGSPAAFRGQLFLLIDSANSSATFVLARVLRGSWASHADRPTDRRQPPRHQRRPDVLLAVAEFRHRSRRTAHRVLPRIRGTGRGHSSGRHGRAHCRRHRRRYRPRSGGGSHENRRLLSSVEPGKQMKAVGHWPTRSVH